MIRRTKGFTLVELLVVVAIIALLVSILLPSLGKAKEQARIVMCLSNLKGLSIACAFYTTENDDWYPATTAYDDLPGSGPGGQRAYTWDTLLESFYGNYGMLHCPCDHLPRTWVWRSGDSIPEQMRHPRSYAMNTWVSCGGPSDLSGYNTGVYAWPGGVHKTTEVENPGETIIIGEMWESIVGPPGAGKYGDYLGCGIDMTHPGYIGYDWPTDDVHRNNDAANYLFCGGHATLLPADDPNLCSETDYHYWDGPDRP